MTVFACIRETSPTPTVCLYWEHSVHEYIFTPVAIIPQVSGITTLNHEKKDGM